MASSPVDQTTQSQPALTTSEEIKSLYPKEVYKNWSKCHGNPDAHRQEELSLQTTAITYIERWIPTEESQFDEEAEHVQGVYQLFQAAAEDHSNKSLVHFFNGRLLRQRQKELDRYKKNIDEINEERRQLKVFEKHYLGRDD
ncbi:hypothetical protein D6D12_09842 [Aureobasidium pullulans]|uniref:Uncharacterized protein n=1 Tax=Aureobasidium pullulans TaxID=5580 RepID=A0AB74JFT0_AURPU|nr:hypothetical protein D6D12_09842 [Aureobasidium pullulans]THX23553.1 hypothetical protein D6D11_10528 [Aureobasidium pullulans]THX60242.1 hypothetical protein D6D08_08783 [Aureobasidium pullulans]